MFNKIVAIWGSFTPEINQNHLKLTNSHEVPTKLCTSIRRSSRFELFHKKENEIRKNVKNLRRNGFLNKSFYRHGIVSTAAPLVP